MSKAKNLNQTSFGGPKMPETLRCLQLRQAPTLGMLARTPGIHPPLRSRNLQTKPALVSQQTLRKPSTYSPRAINAPPVYRPQQKKIAQPKMATATQARPTAKAPAVYRAQPVPKVLQTKLASDHPSNTQPRRLPVAPPVYRPAARKIIQPKVAVSVQTPRPPKSPPVYVYRPQTGPVQPKLAAARAHTPPPAPPVRPRSLTIQRKVIEKKVNGKKVFYSDQDPSSKFDTREEAELHELTLGLPRVDEGTRGPTLYTYTHTKSHCQISSRGVPQGPHTMGHAAASSALEITTQDVHQLLNEQVPPPDVWVQLVIKEKGDPSIFNQNDEFSRRLERARIDYLNLYKATALLLKLGRHDEARNKIGVLMQMSPYATYCWKTMTKASQKSLKYKGEDSVMKDDSNVDTGGKWRDREAFNMFVEDKQLLVDDDFDMSGSSDDNYSDENYSSDSSSEVDEGNYKVPVIVHHQTIKYWFYDDEIPANGDCFFNTLIAMNLHNGNSLQQLRALAAANGGQANIATPNIWANWQDITAIANQFGIRIRVLSIAIHGNAVQQDSTYGAGGPLYVIGHVHGGHYTPLYHL